MKKLPERFLKERFEKDNQYFQVYDCYTPNYKRACITSKFYSKCDAIDFSKADPELVSAIKKALDKGPQERYPWPVTTSHWYGWFRRPLMEEDRNDSRLYHPNVICPITRHEILLRMDRSMDLPKFTGIPFKF